MFSTCNHWSQISLPPVSVNWLEHLFWIYYSLAELFFDIGRFDYANTHIERAKSNAINSPYLSGRAMELQAWFWYKEGRFEDAKSEALRAADVFEKIGATRELKHSRCILQAIDAAINKPATSDEDSDGELLEILPPPTPADFLLSAQSTVKHEFFHQR